MSLLLLGTIVITEEVDCYPEIRFKHTRYLQKWDPCVDFGYTVNHTRSVSIFVDACN